MFESNDIDSGVFEICDKDDAPVDPTEDNWPTDLDNLLESDSSNGIVCSFESEPTTDLPEKDPMPGLDSTGPDDGFDTEPTKLLDPLESFSLRSAYDLSDMLMLSASLAFSDIGLLGASLCFSDDFILASLLGLSDIFLLGVSLELTLEEYELSSALKEIEDKFVLELKLSNEVSLPAKLDELSDGSVCVLPLCD